MLVGVVVISKPCRNNESFALLVPAPVYRAYVMVEDALLPKHLALWLGFPKDSDRD